MHNNFKVGTNFDPALVQGFDNLNKTALTGKVNEVYGSIRMHAKWSARPDFRLPDVTMEELATHVAELKAIGIDFNYTLNTSTFGSKAETLAAVDELSDLLDTLTEIGVARVTIADMLLLDLIRNKIGWQGSIELSTIAHVDAVTQLKVLREEFGVDKVCNNVMKNRSMKFLANAAAYCKESGLVLDLMVNEFCSSATGNATTQCVFRDSCYKCHGSNVEKSDALAFKNYPMGHCSGARGHKPEVWIKSQFVRPEDLKVYNDLGIFDWKITGRTGTTEYILSTTELYLQGSYDGNVLGLWKPLQTISNGRAEADIKHKADIGNKDLAGFLDKWVNDPSFDCANEMCGTTCTYCDDFLKRL